jgi:hypothetical protein
MAIEIEVSVEAYDVNSVIPAKALKPMILANREIERLKAEHEAKLQAQRQKEVKLMVSHMPDIIGRINKRLIQDKSFEVTRGRYAKPMYATEFDMDFSNNDKVFGDVTGKEAYEAIRDLYKEAGYNVDIYVYSASYYKDEKLTISVLDN